MLARLLLNYKQFAIFLKRYHSSVSDWWESTSSCFKENARSFSENSTTQEKIRISRLTKYYETSTKTKILKQKLNQ